MLSVDIVDVVDVGIMDICPSWVDKRVGDILRVVTVDSDLVI